MHMQEGIKRPKKLEFTFYYISWLSCFLFETKESGICFTEFKGATENT